jgi:large subunit ribosomal protein L21
MFAVVETHGKQFKVSPGETLVLDKLSATVGTVVTLDNVLLLGGDTLQIGAPNIPGAKVKAEVVDHFLGDKVITFKYRRTRRYRRRVGFRHSHTTLKILAIET